MPTLARFAAALTLCLIAGCTTNRTAGTPTAVTPATDAQRAATLDRIKALKGTWQTFDAEGKPGGQITYALSSRGSAVREVMFPGSDEEMTNIYHMDGPTLVMTHYCAMGNQPHLRATPGGPSDPIDLRCDGVGNLASPDQMYMGHLTLTILDKDHIRQDWRSFKAGKEDPAHHVVFDLRRVK